MSSLVLCEYAWWIEGLVNIESIDTDSIPVGFFIDASEGSSYSGSYDAEPLKEVDIR